MNKKNRKIVVVIGPASKSYFPLVLCNWIQLPETNTTASVLSVRAPAGCQHMVAGQHMVALDGGAFMSLFWTHLSGSNDLEQTMVHKHYHTL